MNEAAIDARLADKNVKARTVPKAPDEYKPVVGKMCEAEWSYGTEARMETEWGNRNRPEASEARMEAGSDCTNAPTETGRRHASAHSPAELRSEVRGENRSRPQNRDGEQAVHS